VVAAGARQGSVYLPAGATWTDLATGERYAGGQSVVLAAPLERIPVLARDDAARELVGRI
jgi:alpha-D-xyloside xylohydrolase